MIVLVKHGIVSPPSCSLGFFPGWVCSHHFMFKNNTL